MPDIIHLLPDSVANQIAAGEVIQRPASVVKELVENAIDAGSTQVTINIKDAGKTLIQVIDNGHGMSETDARLSFERHATSKINNANDLFAIRSLGFRGEALASIAAIAYVELKTKQADQELGTYLNIVGSEVKEQKNINCPDGSNFLIKNLFFNVPARRKFLKTNSTELRHIIDEFQHIALACPEIKLSLIHNDLEIFNLPGSNLKQRIVNLLGKSSMQNLLPVDTTTSIVKIKGYIGKPEFARKTGGEQFFFVNNRYMRNPYLFKAVMNAYEKILPQGSYPSFFIYFEIDPSQIDINIHPTKTEIKFAEEGTIWQMLQATIRQSLGKFNVVPSIEFNQANPIEISTPTAETEIISPTIEINHHYNPFHTNPGKGNPENLSNWDKLFAPASGQTDSEKQSTISHWEPASDNHNHDNIELKYYQFKNRYILTSVKSGLMIIDQKRAHERILFEKYLNTLNSKQRISQKTIFAKEITYSQKDFNTLQTIIPEIEKFGFEIETGKDNTLIVLGVPDDFNINKTEDLLDALIEDTNLETVDIESQFHEKICMELAIASSIKYGQKLNEVEIRNVIDLLFACRTPNFSPSGKPVLTIISNEELEKKF